MCVCVCVLSVHILHFSCHYGCFLFILHFFLGCLFFVPFARLATADAEEKSCSFLFPFFCYCAWCHYIGYIESEEKKTTQQHRIDWNEISSIKACGWNTLSFRWTWVRKWATIVPFSRQRYFGFFFALSLSLLIDVVVGIRAPIPTLTFWPLKNLNAWHFSA